MKHIFILFASSVLLMANDTSAGANTTLLYLFLLFLLILLTAFAVKKFKRTSKEREGA